MDHDSYWYRYLLARHDTDFYMGVVILCAAMIFTLTGQCLVRNRGLVSRAKEPKTFWQNVVTYYVLGLILFGLWWYTRS
jgi:hypothetical protein